MAALILGLGEGILIKDAQNRLTIEQLVERGINEETNGLLRLHTHKGKNFSGFTQE